MQPRSRQRIAVDIPVVVTTVLDSLEGTIVDLSEGGAQIAGCGLPVRSQCQIDYDGHIVSPRCNGPKRIAWASAFPMS